MLYAKSFFHSDIKPKNIVIDYDLVKDKLIFHFIDFGATTNDCEVLV